MNEHELPPADDRDQLIAEYVLGVLTREEREQVAAMAARDPSVQAGIAAWEDHFAYWLDQVPAAAPPAQAWQAIEAQLFPSDGPARQHRRQWWNALGFWRWSTAVLAAGLLAAVFILVQPQAGRDPAATMLARLEQSDGNLLFAATVQPGSRSVLFVPTRTAFWPDHSAQAWVIASDGKPQSLGLLPANAAAALPVPPELAATLADGAVLAVSLEPMNGSATGQPTGPVIAKGKISSL